MPQYISTILPGRQCSRKMAVGKTTNIGLFSAFSSLSNVFQGPRPALFYGAWGVIPFLTIPTYLCTTESHYTSQLLHANLTYGAGILGFLGAVRWGFAVTNTRDKALKPTYENLGWAVTPTSLGWIALLLTSKVNGNLLVLCSYLATIIQDSYSSAYVAWYKSFRIIFSLCAVFSFGTCLLLFRDAMK